jgi:selenocysteine lyase/cysteine desulfurase
MNKRDFIKHLVALGMSTTAINALALKFEKIRHTSLSNSTTSDEFWEGIRGDYQLKDDYINLENGYYSIMPQPILEEYLQLTENMNLQGSWYMRKHFTNDQVQARKQLAELSGCELEEVVITRNATESLDIVIAGQYWEEGDEAIMAHQDYGAMLNMFNLMKKRYGIVNHMIHIPNHPATDEEIVRLFEDQINDKTKLIMVCHMINITGHVLPVRKICDMAHKHGVQVMVDGAHSFAHIHTNFAELHCDYYGTSLHKWLSAPLGNGMLYVKKGNVAGLWPLMAEDPLPEDDIKKLNHMGTIPPHSMLGIKLAISFHEMIGAERKETRLRYLTTYWTEKVRDLKGIQVNTPKDPQRYCGIANVGVDSLSAKELAKSLLENYKIWTVAIDRPNVHGCRITPNIFTTTSELDALVAALTTLSGN